MPIAFNGFIHCTNVCVRICWNFCALALHLHRLSSFDNVFVAFVDFGLHSGLKYLLQDMLKLLRTIASVSLRMMFILSSTNLIHILVNTKTEFY